MNSLQLFELGIAELKKELQLGRPESPYVQPPKPFTYADEPSDDECVRCGGECADLGVPGNRCSACSMSWSEAFKRN